MSTAAEVAPALNEKTEDVVPQQNGAAHAQPNGKAPEAGKPSDTNEKKEPPKQDAKDKPAESKKEEKQPAGGFDDTPIPKRPAGYDVKFTFHRATNLPMADINSLSSDPYVIAQLNTDVPTRHKEDPFLRFRTTTVRRNTKPVWDEEWIVANVPASGFKLKLHVLDEDPADKDDLLGRIHINVDSINEGWPGIKDQSYKIRAAGGSIRAYSLQILSTCFREDKHLRGHLSLSIEVLGRTREDGQSGRLYTVGPVRWTRHYSPMLGRLVNIRDPENDSPSAADTSASTKSTKPRSPTKHNKETGRYDFQANQVQLRGPIPADLYHRFVEFKPWVGRMFTSAGFSGAILGKALHHQHNRVYNHGRSTLTGIIPENSGDAITRKFLDLVHYDNGGRIFTYILTLDALWRFTETGKEFGVDMLSKHTMHSDVSIYIAFSGEFFIRRLKHASRPPAPDPVEPSSQDPSQAHAPNPSHPPDDIAGGPPDDDPPKDPHYYELVIDNDSGTYRPNAAKLPQLKDFLSHALPGLHILTLDCNKDAERQQRLKAQQRARKKKEGKQVVYTQGDDGSSISSSDEEDLDAAAAEHAADGPGANATDEPSILAQVARDAKKQQKAKFDHFKRNYGQMPGAGREQGEAA